MYMICLGLDLGSTTISGVVFDTTSGRVIQSYTTPIEHRLPADQVGAYLYDADRIVDAAKQQLAWMRNAAPKAVSIGLTGQMHGIVYIGNAGQAVSPLYSWQDQRGLSLAPSGITYVDELSALTGYSMATGYGLTTHYVLRCQSLVPDGAITFCTIADYLAMRLCGRSRPLLHHSMAHSIGFWNMKTQQFDLVAADKAGMKHSFFPETTTAFSTVGLTAEKTPISVAIGDNQAGFFGSVANPETSVLLNVGTSGQISLQLDELPVDCDIELRPLANDTRLAVGASLCGGQAYQQLAGLVADCVRLCGLEPPNNIYQRMNRAAAVWQGEPPLIQPTFSGTRHNPLQTGTITRINRDNLTCGALARGTIDGIVNELFDLFKPLKKAFTLFDTVVVSGNAMRRNPMLRKAAYIIFGAPVKMTIYQEEAAVGAALASAVSCGAMTTPKAIHNCVQYATKHEDSV